MGRARETEEGFQLSVDSWERGGSEDGQSLALGLLLSKEKGMLGVGGSQSHGKGQVAGGGTCPSRCEVST